MTRPLAAALLLALAPAAFARTPEAIRDARAELREEQREYRQIDRIGDRWTAAAEADRVRAMARQDRKLEAWIERELKENKAERTQARRQLERLGGDPDAVAGRSAAQPHTPAHARDAHAAFRRSHAAVLDVRALSYEVNALQPIFDLGVADPSLIDRKSMLLEDLRASQAADVQRAKNKVTKVERQFR